MNHSRRPAWFAYLCALLAFAFFASSSAAALAMAGSIWTSAALSARSDAVLLGNIDPRVDVPGEGDGALSDGTVPIPAVLEEERVEEEGCEDDPVPGAEQRLVELTARWGRLVVWDRPDFARPVKDPVDETSSPPPRA
ncbi:hypothetical protein LVJ94_49390 [Pendulispora rubella]|uniref:Uncharacterized protein n=1 Tax=Pendulispora rubella TaxID=2741070 RepID=A0ABZ2L1T6_9BACT